MSSSMCEINFWRLLKAVTLFVKVLFKAVAIFVENYVT